jgi:hypothetical protein
MFFLFFPLLFTVSYNGFIYLGRKTNLKENLSTFLSATL